MTQRRRLSRAQVAATPERRVPSQMELEVLRHSQMLVEEQARDDEAAERRAVARTGRVLVAWLIGRWRDQVSGK